MNLTMDRNAAMALNVAMVASALTIIVTAFALSPEKCSAAKADVAALKVEIAHLEKSVELAKIERAEIPKGTCHFYPEQEQEVCRKSNFEGGLFYVRERLNSRASMANEDRVSK